MPEKYVQFKRKVSGSQTTVVGVEHSLLTRNKTLGVTFLGKFGIGKSSNQHLLEVFDVIIRSPCRLSIVDNGTNRDILHSENYLNLVRSRLGERQSENDSDQGIVYNTAVDPARYDVRSPAYRQTHCLRFEIDRSKHPEAEARSNRLRLTDVDFCLDGNRHAKLLF